jgi:hypothetical protein
LFAAYIGVASWFQKRTIETKNGEDLLFFGNLFSETLRREGGGGLGRPSSGFSQSFAFH